MGPCEPSLFDVPCRLFSFRNRPKRRDEWSSMLIDCHRVKSYFDMVTETRVVKAECHEREISGERSKTNPRGDGIRPYGVPDANAGNRARVMKRLLCGKRVVIG